MFGFNIRRIFHRADLKHRVVASNQVRYLFSAEELGIKKYEESRQSAGRAIRNHEFFKQTIKNRLRNPKYELLLLESDLRNLLHLMTNTKGDVEILMSALHQLVKKRKDYEGDKYRIGTILMRMFAFLKMPNEALMIYNDAHLNQLFSEGTCHQILLDILYENKKYDEVLQTYDHLRSSRQIQDNKYIDVIVLATYYRINTAAAYEQAMKLWNTLSESDTIQFRKSRTFVAALAVNQKQSDVALRILEGDSLYVTMRHIKFMAWAQTRQFQKIFKAFDALLKSYKSREKNNVVPLTSLEVLMVIEKSIQHGGTPEDKIIYRRIREQIKSLDLITNESFDDIICAPFMTRVQANTYHRRL